MLLFLVWCLPRGEYLLSPPTTGPFYYQVSDLGSGRSRRLRGGCKFPVQMPIQVWRDRKSPGESARYWLLLCCWFVHVLIKFDFGDPYHTYLSLAAISLLKLEDGVHESWRLPRLDPLLNATEETVAWIKTHVPEA